MHCTIQTGLRAKARYTFPIPPDLEYITSRSKVKNITGGEWSETCTPDNVKNSLNFQITSERLFIEYNMQMETIKNMEIELQKLRHSKHQLEIRQIELLNHIDNAKGINGPTEQVKFFTTLLGTDSGTFTVQLDAPDTADAITYPPTKTDSDFPHKDEDNAPPIPETKAREVPIEHIISPKKTAVQVIGSSTATAYLEQLKRRKSRRDSDVPDETDTASGGAKKKTTRDKVRPGPSHAAPSTQKPTAAQSAQKPSAAPSAQGPPTIIDPIGLVQKDTQKDAHLEDIKTRLQQHIDAQKMEKMRAAEEKKRMLEENRKKQEQRMMEEQQLKEQWKKLQEQQVLTQQQIKVEPQDECRRPVKTSQTKGVVLADITLSSDEDMDQDENDEQNQDPNVQENDQNEQEEDPDNEPELKIKLEPGSEKEEQQEEQKEDQDSEPNYEPSESSPEQSDDEDQAPTRPQRRAAAMARKKYNDPQQLQ